MIAPPIWGNTRKVLRWVEFIRIWKTRGYTVRMLKEPTIILLVDGEERTIAKRLEELILTEVE